MKLLHFFHVSGPITQKLKPGPPFFIIFLNSTHFSASIALQITKIGLKLQEIQLFVLGGRGHISFLSLYPFGLSCKYTNVVNALLQRANRQHSRFLLVYDGFCFPCKSCPEELVVILFLARLAQVCIVASNANISRFYFRPSLGFTGLFFSLPLLYQS